MVDEAYKWKITLADGTVKEEWKDNKYNKFDLAWEEEGAIKSIELVGEKALSCNLETGEFNINGEKSTPPNIDGPKSLYFKKRRQVRTDGKSILSSRTRYIIGYIVNGKIHTASIQPAVGMMPEEIVKPKIARESETSDIKLFENELINLKGIGAKTAEQILRLAITKEELAKVPRDDLIEALRDDVVEILDTYLGR